MKQEEEPSVQKKAKAVATAPPTAGALATESERKRATLLAELATQPSFSAAAVIAEFGGASGELELKALPLRLSDSVDAVWANDMRGPEAMLYSEAHAPQAIFVDLSRRATKQSHMGNYESFMRMALKAQNQCRMTLETLATIKIPPAVFARLSLRLRPGLYESVGPIMNRCLDRSL